MTNETTNGTGNNRLPDRADQPEPLLTDEAEKLIRHVLETPIETDEDLTELGETYNE